MQAYAEYKDSGVDWLGEIPAGWEKQQVKRLFAIGRGRVISKEELDENGSFPVYSSQTKNSGILGYINTCDFDAAQITWTTDGVNAGTVFLRSGKYNCTNVCGTLKPKTDRTNLPFCAYTIGVAALFYKRPDTNGAKIMNEEMAVIEFPLPPLAEQTAIANFLDDKTAKIEALVGIKRRQIELLEERKQILIQNAVTKGLNPDAPMKDSGIDWIGTIPTHWEVKRVKHLLTERNERSESGDEPLLMVSQIYGLVVRADFHSKSEVAATSVGSKVVHENDLVFNKLKAHLGVFFKSKIQGTGIVSPDYAVYIPSGEVPNNQFFEILFRHPAYIAQFIVRATGIVEGLIRLYTSELFDIPVAVPPLKEQQEIIESCAIKSKEILAAIKIKENQIAKLNEYKTTLINAAVTGKIKVA